MNNNNINMPIITEIQIKNFRSIKNLTVKTNRLNIFAGRNDSGKSNLLRSLNLFFNEETDPETPFEFEKDINLHILKDKKYKKAKEVSVQLKIKLPESYKNSGHFVIWTKRWRRNNIKVDEKESIIITPTKRKNSYIESKKEISSRSKVHQLLNQMVFLYVPALKDKAFFKKLQKNLYEAISQSAKNDFEKITNNFNNSISPYLNNLTNDIYEKIGINSKLLLPNDLGKIFESLEFISDDIPLDFKGDGIKARHIPSILRYISNQIQSSRAPKSIPYNFIWGYEEPENSLEFLSSIELSEYFLETLKSDNISQIFITTHSPVFYELDNKYQKSYIYHVYKDNEDKKTSVKSKEQINSNELDESIGTINFITPYLKKAQQDIEKIKNKMNELQKKNVFTKNTIFCEGESDKNFIHKIIESFYGEEALSQVSITHGNGANFVKDNVLAWFHYFTHEPNKMICLGILDNDIAGNSAYDETKKIINNSNYAYIIKIKRPYFPETPAHEDFVIKYKNLCELEDLYDRDSWITAIDNKWCKERRLPEIIENFISKFKNEKDIYALLSSYDFKLFLEKDNLHPSIFYKCKKDKKAEFNNLVMRLTNNEFKEKYKNVFKELKEHLDKLLNN